MRDGSVERNAATDTCNVLTGNQGESSVIVSFDWKDRRLMNFFSREHFERKLKIL
jgi:hypothetical protein